MSGPRSGWHRLAGTPPATAWEGHADRYADGMTESLLVNGWLKEPRMVLVPAVSSSDALTAIRWAPAG